MSDNGDLRKQEMERWRLIRKLQVMLVSLALAALWLVLALVCAFTSGGK